MTLGASIVIEIEGMGGDRDSFEARERRSKIKTQREKFFILHTHAHAHRTEGKESVEEGPCHHRPHTHPHKHNKGALNKCALA